MHVAAMHGRYLGPGKEAGSDSQVPGCIRAPLLGDLPAGEAS